MIQASIDIGTNTVLLLVAERQGDRLEIIEERQQVPRLGRNVDEERNLSQDAMDRVVAVLKEYLQLLNRNHPNISPPIVTATSAVRDANNRAAFLDYVREQTGLKIQILSGLEEAEYTFLGAKSILQDGNISNKHPKAVLDIGGGSTEMAVGEDTEIVDRYSFDMGCVRFTERYLKEDPPTEAQIASCRKAVQQMLEEYSFNLSLHTQLIGVSGTVTSLAYIDREIMKYHYKNIDGYRLSFESIQRHLMWLSDMSSEELVDRYPEVMTGRGDIFLAGLLILEGIMDRYEFNSLMVSTGGIRHGAILQDSQK